MNLYNKTRKNEKYLAWVRNQPCLWCAAPAEPHHIKEGLPTELKGGMGLKSHDLCSIPLCRACHDRAHSGDLPINPLSETVKYLVRYIEED